MAFCMFGRNRLDDALEEVADATVPLRGQVDRADLRRAEHVDVEVGRVTGGGLQPVVGGDGDRVAVHLHVAARRPDAEQGVRLDVEAQVQVAQRDRGVDLARLGIHRDVPVADGRRLVDPRLRVGEAALLVDQRADRRHGRRVDRGAVLDHAARAR